MFRRVFSAGICLVSVFYAFVGHAHALDNSIIRQLNALDPEERLEQRCDMEAMDRIRKDQKGFRPDKVIAYTFGDPKVAGNSIVAPGAVVRSRGAWYKLQYKCKTGAAHLEVKSFDYKMGDRIPRSKWRKYYLYD